MNINICYSINNLQVKYCAVSIASVLYNSNPKDNYTLHILSEYISKENKNKLEELKAIRKFKIKYHKLNLQDIKKINSADKYKFLLFDLIKEDKVIYLDYDTIVQKDIEELYKINLNNFCCAGVENIIKKVYLKNICLKPQDAYINTGVMLVDLKNCRKENVFSEIKKHLFNINSTWSETNILNFALRDKITLLDLKFNFMYPYQNEYENQAQYNNTAKNPFIIHYITPNKPWRANCSFKEEFFKYAKFIPWEIEISSNDTNDISENLKKEFQQIKTKLSSPDNIHKINNTRFYLPNYPIDLIQTAIADEKEYWDMYAHNHTDKYIKENAVILDIGANIGSHSLYWAIEKNAKKIYSFEPVKETFEILTKNIEINNLENIIEAHNIGLCDIQCNAFIDNFDCKNIGGTNLAKNKNGNIALKPLDSFNFEKIDFIKIDVEGMEVEVLKGAKETLKKHKPTISIETFGKKGLEVDSILKELGYAKIETIREDADYIYQFCKE